MCSCKLSIKCVYVGVCVYVCALVSVCVGVCLFLYLCVC